MVGGGSGQRFGKPKQYEPLDDRRVIDHARATAARCSDGVVVVVPASDVASEGGIAGGATRSASVRAGLEALPDGVDIVCVHDAARPLASEALFAAVIDAVRAGADAAVPGVPVSDTIKIVDGGEVVETPDRSTLVAVQTPQAFRHSVLVDAHARSADATDDAALVEAAGGRVVVVSGEATNRKITQPDDLEWARRVIAERGGSAEVIQP